MWQFLLFSGISSLWLISWRASKRTNCAMILYTCGRRQGKLSRPPPLGLIGSQTGGKSLPGPGHLLPAGPRSSGSSSFGQHSTVHQRTMGQTVEKPQELSGKNFPREVLRRSLKWWYRWYRWYRWYGWYKWYLLSENCQAGWLAGRTESTESTESTECT